MEKSKFENNDLQQRDTAKKVSIRVTYSCAQCGYFLCYEEDIRENFCPCCGQRLDWSNVDNNGKLVKTQHGLEIKEESR